MIFISPLLVRLAASLVCLSGLGSSTGQYLQVDGGRLDLSDKYLHQSSRYMPVSVHVWLIPQTSYYRLNRCSIRAPISLNWKRISLGAVGCELHSDLSPKGAVWDVGVGF